MSFTQKFGHKGQYVLLPCFVIRSAEQHELIDSTVFKVSKIVDYCWQKCKNLYDMSGFSDDGKSSDILELSVALMVF